MYQKFYSHSIGKEAREMMKQTPFDEDKIEQFMFKHPVLSLLIEAILVPIIMIGVLTLATTLFMLPLSFFMN